MPRHLSIFRELTVRRKSQMTVGIFRVFGGFFSKNTAATTLYEARALVRASRYRQQCQRSVVTGTWTQVSSYRGCCSTNWATTSQLWNASDNCYTPTLWYHTKPTRRRYLIDISEDWNNLSCHHRCMYRLCIFLPYMHSLTNMATIDGSDMFGILSKHRYCWWLMHQYIDTFEFIDVLSIIWYKYGSIDGLANSTYN